VNDSTMSSAEVLTGNRLSATVRRPERVSAKQLDRYENSNVSDPNSNLGRPVARLQPTLRAAVSAPAFAFLRASIVNGRSTT
jgi:hypothetical protein